MTQWLHSLLIQVAQMGGWGVLFFLLLYVLAALTMAPAFPLTVAAGAIYGVARGSAVVFVGAALGGMAAYAVASRLADSRLLRRLDREPRVIVVRNAIRRDSVWVQFLLRLSPLVPFTLLNYALGLARVRFRDFLVALVGMVPAIIMYTYYGKVVGDVTALAAGRTAPMGAGYYTLVGIGLVATVIATTMITRAARRALRAHATEPTAPA
jgi:uncharacterized membrane protein YdjX (TVP38/TMEM64 family)